MGIPADLKKSLTGSAKAAWESLTPIGRRDFIRWVESAKQPETRKRRIAVTRSKLLSGQRRPCCYAVVPMSLYKTLGELPKAKTAWRALTPDERRDFVAWIDEAKDKESQIKKVEKVVVMLLGVNDTPDRARERFDILGVYAKNSPAPLV